MSGRTIGREFGSTLEALDRAPYVTRSELCDAEDDMPSRELGFGSYSILCLCECISDPLLASMRGHCYQLCVFDVRSPAIAVQAIGLQKLIFCSLSERLPLHRLDLFILVSILLPECLANGCWEKPLLIKEGSGVLTTLLCFFVCIFKSLHTVCVAAK